MLFNSYEFIFIFLPITFFIYFYLNSKKIVVASKIFLVFVITQEKNKILKEHFNNKKDLLQRNKAIIDVIEDSYKQSQIARYLNLSPAMVLKVFRGIK